MQTKRRFKETQRTKKTRFRKRNLVVSAIGVLIHFSRFASDFQLFLFSAPLCICLKQRRDCHFGMLAKLAIVFPTKDHSGRPPRTYARCGFSIVELLVVISIIGILVSIVLPAVQMAREAARRTQCKKNLKELGLAAHNFHETFQYLPAGTDIQNIGPILSLTPYLDQKAYYDGFSFDPNYTNWYQNPLNRPPSQPTGGLLFPNIPVPRPPDRYGAEGTIPALVCPSSPSPDQITTVLLFENRGIPGVNFPPDGYISNYNIFSGDPGNWVLTRSHYAAVGGDWYYGNGDGHYLGMFRYSPGYSGPVPSGFQQAKGIRFSDVTDGLSSTLMFGETGANMYNYSTPNQTIWTSMTTATTQLYFTDGFNDNCCGNTFGAQHTNIIHFVFADGHVAAIANTPAVGIGPGDPGDNDYSQELTEGPVFFNMLRLGGISDGEIPADY
jgi:prepilin-type N-terminal cleavage/methylation domain-containing protein